MALLFPVLLFTALGLSLVGVAAWVLWGALFGNTRSWGERARFKRREDMLRRADVALDSKNFTEALKLVEGSLFLDHVRSDLSLIEKVLGHHMGMLSRLISIAEEQDQSVSNLAVIEDLLQTRCELMRSYVEAATTREALRRNRKKPVPRWAVDEYDRKISEISERIATNRRSLNSQLSLTFGQLRSPVTRKEAQPDGQGGMTIH